MFRPLVLVDHHGAYLLQNAQFARQQALSVLHLWKAPEIVKQYLTMGQEELRAAAEAAARAGEAAAEVAVEAAARAGEAAAWAAAESAAEAAAEVAVEAASWDAAKKSFEQLVNKEFGLD